MAALRTQADRPHPPTSRPLLSDRAVATKAFLPVLSSSAGESRLFSLFHLLSSLLLIAGTRPELISSWLALTRSSPCKGTPMARSSTTIKRIETSSRVEGRFRAGVWSTARPLLLLQPNRRLSSLRPRRPLLLTARPPPLLPRPIPPVLPPILL
jgi:hypothetical protein